MVVCRIRRIVWTLVSLVRVRMARDLNPDLRREGLLQVPRSARVKFCRAYLRECCCRWNARRLCRCQRLVQNSWRLYAQLTDRVMQVVFHAGMRRDVDCRTRSRQSDEIGLWSGRPVPARHCNNERRAFSLNFRQIAAGDRSEMRFVGSRVLLAVVAMKLSSEIAGLLLQNWGFSADGVR